MILISQAEMTMLKKGVVREITIRKGRPRPGAKAARCRWTVGRDYAVTARAVKDKDGIIIKAKRDTRCLLLSITEGTHDWVLVITPRAMAERPVFLAANPGAQRSDYAFDPAHALRGEPEVLGEDAIDIIARLAKAERLNTAPDRRPWAA